MEQKTPRLSRLALILALLVPAYFAVAALGTKFGIWGWQTGLGTLVIGGGPIVLGAVALIAVIALIMALIKKPRRGWMPALLALVVPAGIFAMLASVGTTAAENPIYDVATDTANPPSFSEATVADRAASESNAFNDYQTPIGEFEKWQGASDELKARSHAQIITDTQADLAPLPLGGVSKADAVAAVAAAMEDMGFSGVTSDAETGQIEGVAETFWFGFKDDVVARVGEAQIDFRSVSRVGTSDLGANAARIAELRANVEGRLNP